MIHSTRIQRMNDRRKASGEFVLYWMQASQRVGFNHALCYAIEQANKQGKPLVAVFGLDENYPAANARHFKFMLEGLRETKRELAELGVRMVIRRASPDEAAIELAKMACLVVTDRGYLRHQRLWRKHVADRIAAPLFQVETDVIVPIEIVSNKEEFAARTIRPKINRLLKDYLHPVAVPQLQKDSLGMQLDSFSIEDGANFLERLDLDHCVSPVGDYCGGTSEARRRLDEFIIRKLDRYDSDRNDPNLDGLSTMSPYLHFGQISPLEIALRVMEADSHGEPVFLEELIIRRELSMNFVYYNDQYDRYAGLPQWCRETLAQHAGEARGYLYSLEELENGRTHDPYWNAAQHEMLLTGKMHGYMRMYWGKKILEWSSSPEEAYQRAIFLNDKYELDGRDPNGYTGVAWCFGKHDRPWGERPVFGKVRYMNDKGLRRKFDADGYVRKVEGLRHRQQID